MTDPHDTAYELVIRFKGQPEDDWVIKVHLLEAEAREIAARLADGTLELRVEQTTKVRRTL